MARMKELKREPEVIFWVFIFPLLLALGLGIAFRNKPADITSIAIVAGPGADKAMSLLETKRSSIHAEVLDQSLALQGFRLGKYDLVAEPDAVKELDRQLNLNEAVLRTKILRPDVH